MTAPALVGSTGSMWSRGHGVCRLGDPLIVGERQGNDLSICAACDHFCTHICMSPFDNCKPQPQLGRDTGHRADFTATCCGHRGADLHSFWAVQADELFGDFVIGDLTGDDLLAGVTAFVIGTSPGQISLQRAVI